MRLRSTLFLTSMLCAWTQPTVAATDLERILSCNDWAIIATAPELLRPTLQSMPGVT